MQTLRKKTSPLKYKNETTRFLGDGVSFKAKLIGILEVSEARGDRMCQEALSDLKMAIRAAGEHKQRITINIAIDGLRLRDEKTGDSLYHHPVHKISFIAQDMTDSRAFGYIFGSPDIGHRFFGIKTDKAASQVVIAMRDLFQVVFALKKKEIELAKQHLDTSRFTNSSLFLDSSATSTKPVTQEHLKSTTSETKAPASLDIKSTGTAVADLVDLELELNSLQQGLTQMERITPSDPFISKDDPFGDSFTSYNKPILPPPPSSGKERSNRSFEPSSVFNSKVSQPTDNTTTNYNTNILFSKEGNDCIKSQKGASTTEDWFNEPNKVFEEPSLVPEPTKDEKHEITKQEILSQFDVFTELDPLGTGKIKPYVDKKHFFKELKNPPKKVLNDLVSQPQDKTSTFSSEFNSDPFGDDPFVTEDPFAETDFTKQDPFEREFGNFGAKDQERNEDVGTTTENLSFSQSFSKISNEKHSLNSGSNLSKTNNVEKKISIDKSEVKPDNKLIKLHENLSFNVSLEAESAPEPPPRPESTLNQIKPPPLPPKKQGNEFFVRPPPRPPQMEALYFDCIDDYETVSNVSGHKISSDKNPPIPVPLRKSKFETELGSPERPKKDSNVTAEGDYLTPVSGNENNKVKYISSSGTPTLLPPPQKTLKKQNISQVSAESFVETRSSLPTTTATGAGESIDINLSQLTLSGLNELARKLNISSNQLNNMTLAQLTSYLSNFLKSNNVDKGPITTENSKNMVPTFNADFAANFNNLDGNTIATSESYDRYAVFRELINEEIKQTIIDADPEELKNDKLNFPSNTDVNISRECVDNEKIQDKYAALREIVESELKSTEPKNGNENDDTSGENVFSDDQKIKSRVVNETNIINSNDKPTSPNYDIIEYNTSLDNTDVKASNDSLKSPKSPINKLIKSPVPLAIAEIMHNNIRLNSGSLSDVVSGSSPDIDNTGSNSEVGKKTEDDAAGEAWAIFDQGVPQESMKEKQTIPSEEGVSPWSSDSKEFGNSSPPVWQPRDTEGCGDQWTKHVRRDQDGWWDTSAEPEVLFYPNHRSTDSYEDEYYERCDKPRRRKQAGYVHSTQGAGGHSSSSRDVSPWEEEPHRREQRGNWGKHIRQHSFEKYRDRRRTDSWDDEDDYEYEEEERPPRYHRSDRQKWEIERERYNAVNRDTELDKWNDDWSEDRRRRHRREGRCCPDWDVNEHDKPINWYNFGRWGGGMDEPQGSWRDRLHENRCYGRDSQESPWEDDCSNETEEFSSSHYLTKRSWKRPSSASEMDRKTTEFKSRHYLVTGGSDGERERRYKPGRRSRSRDSQYSEPIYRHKNESSLLARGSHRTKQYLKQFDNDFTEFPTKKHLELSKPEFGVKKTVTLVNRKKNKDNPKPEVNVVSTFPRKSTLRTRSLFENDFVPSENVHTNSAVKGDFSFENDFETSEAESATVVSSSLNTTRIRNIHQRDNLESIDDHYQRKVLKDSKMRARLQEKSRSLFEDNFSPNGKSEVLEDIKKEGIFLRCEDSYVTEKLESSAINSRRKKVHRQKLSNNNVQSDNNIIKKSESVNIFARESDPFDDDFFSEGQTHCADIQDTAEYSPKTNDLKWSDEFESFDTGKGN